MDQLDVIVENIKKNCPIDQVMDKDGFHLQGGRGRKQICKEHDSLVVDVENHRYYWNSEKEGGDTIKWRMNRRGLDFKAACDDLTREFGLEPIVWGKVDMESIKVKEEQRAREDVLEVAAGVFTEWLWRSPAALDYCRKNRCWTDETIRLARLGFSGSGSGAEYKEMTNKLIEAGIDVRSPAAIGVLGMHPFENKSEAVSRWMQDHEIDPSKYKAWVEGGYLPGMIGRERIVYPFVVDGHIAYNKETGLKEARGGKVVYLTGRGIEDKPILDDAGQPVFDSNGKAKVDRGIHALPEILGGPMPLYRNFAYRHNSDNVVVVEGQADAISLAQWGYAGVALGNIQTQNTLKTDQVRDIGKNERHKAIYIGLDSDKGGSTGRWGVADHIGPMARMLTWPIGGYPTYTGLDGNARECKDANDLLRAFLEAGVAPEEQKALIYAAMQKAPTYVEERCAAAGKAEGAERDEAVKGVLLLIARMSELDQANYRTKICKALGVNVRDLNNMLKTATANAKEKDLGEPIYTFGGYYPSTGWLLEYLYDPQNQYAQLAWRDPDGNIGSGDSVVIEGQKYMPWPPNETVESQAIGFPSKLGDEKTIGELVTLVETFIRTHYMLPSNQVARLMSYYVLLTWIYDAFNTIIYLRATGDAGSGKSELMRRIGLLCYRTMSANGAGSTSSLFRALERYRGTVFIDEADINNSDTESDMIKFYNLGAMRGNPIWRTVEITGPNGNKDFEEKAFQTFCPKLISMRKEFRDDAVGSRSLTFKLQPREVLELRKAGVSLEINAAMREQATAIRNLLLRWRLKTWRPEIEINPDFYEMSISARLNQVAGPLLALAQEDPEQQEEIRKNLRDYYQESILERSMTIGARVIEAMWKIMKYPDLRGNKDMVRDEPDGTAWIKVASVTSIANQLIAEMNGTKDEEDDDGDKKRKNSTKEMTPHGIGRLLRNELQLQMSPRRRDGFWVRFDDTRLEGLSIRYGVNPEELGPVAKPVQGRLA